MLTFLDYPFDMTNYFCTSYSQVLTRISKLAGRHEIGLLLPANKRNSVVVGS